MKQVKALLVVVVKATAVAGPFSGARMLGRVLLAVCCSEEDDLQV